MKGHGDNGSTATRGLSSNSSPHISSSDKLLHDQELQHLVTSSIPSPPYSGLSLINASAALVFGADPIYYPLLYMSHIQQMEIGRSPLPSGKSQDLLKASSPPVISNNNNNNNNINKNNKNSKNNKNNNNNNNDNNNNKNKNKEVNGKSQGQTSPTQNGSRDKVFTCPTCNRCFGYKHVLQNHERTHTGEKPFECNICNKKFTRDHHLKTHMRLHTGEKPYQCTHCDRQFVQVANLRRHLRVHTGERPYACELCSSRFSDSNQLKAHMLIHKGEKPYECQECGSHFRRRHHLAHHKCVGESEAEGGTTAQRSKVTYPASSSSSSPDTSPPQLLTPASVTSGVGGAEENPRSSTKRANGTGGNGGGSAGKRGRKCQETRRIIKLEPLNLSTSVGSPTPLTTFLPGAAVPEQDHPEDLSMNGSGLRGRHYSGSSSSVTASSSPSPRSGSDTSVYNF